MPQRRRRKIATVKRGDAAEVIERESDEVATREGQLLDLKEPQFLSIVKSPANRTPFKIVRDDQGGPRRRRKTADANALLTVTLPEGIEMEDAEAIFTRFGLTSEEFSIETDEDGRIRYVRTARRDEDLQTVAINMGNGVIAYVEAAALQRGMPEAPDHPGCTILRFDFESQEVGEEWLKRNEISTEGKWLEMEESVIFCRHDIMPPEGSIEIKLDGVTMTVAQTKDDDIPVRIYRQVIEELYGSYGWGIIDFGQAMANEIFVHDTKNANYLLWDIIDNILFYSELPLADRQALVMNALNQFAVWLTNVMSALPRQMTDPENRIDLNSQGASDDNAARSETDPPEETKETADMSKDKEQNDAQGAEDQETVERQEASDESQETEAKATADEQAETEDKVEREEETEDTEKVFTRTEAETIAASAVESYVASQTAKREDNPNVEMGKAVGAAISEALSPVVQRMDTLQQEVNSVKSTTVAREDDLDDGDGGAVDEAEIKRLDPFRGSMFPGLYERESA
jgi:hypothetical protein